MELRLPVTYLESYVPPRKRKARYRPVQTEDTFVLPEAEPAAAPVAATLRSQGKAKRASRELRAWKGALVERADDAFERELDAVRLASEVNRQSHDEEAMLSPRELARETVRRRIQSSIDAFVRIDGHVWRHVPEPRIVVVRYDADAGGRVVMLIDDHYRAGLPCSAYFNLRDGDAARRHARSMAEDEGDADAPLDLLPAIAVRLPKAFTVNPSQGCGGEGAPSTAMQSAVLALLADAKVDVSKLVTARRVKPRPAPLALTPSIVTERPAQRKASTPSEDARLAEVLTLLCGEPPPPTLVDQIGRLDARVALERWIERKRRDRLAWASGATVLAAARELAARDDRGA